MRAMVHLSCDNCADLLGDHLDGILAGDVRDALEAHVSGCAACANLLGDYRAIPDLVRRATDAAMPYEAEIRLRRLLSIAHRRIYGR